MSQFLGSVTIAVDGVRLETMPGAKIDIGGYTNKPVVTSRGVGYTKEMKEATVECEVAISSETDLAAINSTSKATLTVETDVGKHYVIRNAFRVDPLTFTGGEGKGAVKYAGDPAEAI